MCIFVIQFISMSTILLTIGSNTFAKTNIDKAKRMLTFLFPDIIFSEPILTEPEEEKYSYLFRNVLAVVDTEMRPEEVIDKIKQTERAVGRRSEEHTSELQSRPQLVCRLLLEKKKENYACFTCRRDRNLAAPSRLAE